MPRSCQTNLHFSLNFQDWLLLEFLLVSCLCFYCSFLACVMPNSCLITAYHSGLCPAYVMPDYFVQAATLFITLVLIFIDIEHILCLPVWFSFYQLGLCSVSYTATLFITLVLIVIDIQHSLCLPVWFCFYQLGLCCVQ